MFSGQGSQYFQMGRTLFENHDGFRRRMRRMDERIRPRLGRSVIDYMYADGKTFDDAFDRVLYSSPAIFMVEHALASVLMDAGAEPDYVLGTSLGEFTASAAVGAVDPDEVLELATAQAEILEDICDSGGMMAVLASPDLYDTDPVFEETVELAAVNFDAHFVVSGLDDGLDRLAAHLDAEDVTYQRLPVSRSFHASTMDPAESAVRDFFRGQTIGTPDVPLVSSLYGDVVTDLPDDAEEYLWNVIRQPIRFRDALHAVDARHDEVTYVDLGPSGTLATFARHGLPSSSTRHLFSILTPFAQDVDNLTAVQEHLGASDGTSASVAISSSSDSPTSASTSTMSSRTLTAYVFPGQGSQRRGMGSGLFDRFSEWTEQASAILGYSIRDLCLDDPDRVLNQTEYTQPALYVVNALTYRAQLEDASGAPDFVAGHSLGEYNALLAAGVFDFETGLRLVKERGRLMGQLDGGGMAAVIGLDKSDVESVLEGVDGIDIANCNSPFQFVLSGQRDDVEAAQDAFEEAGADLYLPLNVSGAFHSRYMEPVRDEFASFLETVTFDAPTIPVVANAEARPYAEGRVEELLARQLVEPVRWNESIQYLLAKGEIEITEIGPGDVLTKLTRYIRRDAPEPEVASEATSEAASETTPELTSEATPEPVPEASESVESESTPPQPPTVKSSASEPARPESAPPEPVSSRTSDSHQGDGQVAPGPDAPPHRARPEASARETSRSRRAPDRSVASVSLGRASFRRRHGLNAAYLVGGMERGVSSVEMVTRLAETGLLGFFGTHRLDPEAVNDALGTLRRTLGDDRAYGANLVSTPSTPAVEDAMVDAFLRHDVRLVEAAGYIQMSPALVRYRLQGLREEADGSVRATHRIVAKASRPEVVEAFLRPAPRRVVDRLVENGRVTAKQAELARRVPVADDLCVQADAAWRTSKSTLAVLLPAALQLRDEQMAQHGYDQPIHVGAAGGLGTPEAVASAFLLGAEFVETGSVNLSTVESGMSRSVKDALQKVDVQDTDYAPASEMFEMGAESQVLKKGTFFPARARKLYSIYQHHEGLDDLDAETRSRLEQYFGQSIESVYDDVRASLSDRAPDLIDRAERDPKTRMGLVFRWYLDHAAELAVRGQDERRVDYNVPCGPALGAFNRWAQGTDLEHWQNRHVDVVAEHLMTGAVEVLRRRLRSVASDGESTATTSTTTDANASVAATV